jgi:hypothetical protein
VTLRLTLAARHRLLVTVRRAGARRALLVLRPTGRRGRNVLLLPSARVGALGPGRYAIDVRVADGRGKGTGSRAFLVLLRP